MADEEEKKENAQAPEGAEASENQEPAQTEQEKHEAKNKKKSFRLFLLLTFINLGFLSWLIYTMRFQVEKPQPAAQIESQKPEQLASEEYEEILDVDTIAIEPFLVNVVARHDGRARLGQKVLRVRFEVIPESENTINSIERYMPKIRDSVNMLLSSQDYADLSMSQGREALRGLIKDQINEVIQPEKIQKLYFTEFVIN